MIGANGDRRIFADAVGGVVNVDFPDRGTVAGFLYMDIEEAVDLFGDLGKARQDIKLRERECALYGLDRFVYVADVVCRRVI